jgi:hypothetical protein
LENLLTKIHRTDAFWLFVTLLGSPLTLNVVKDEETFKARLQLLELRGGLLQVQAAHHAVTVPPANTQHPERRS